MAPPTMPAVKHGQTSPHEEKKIWWLPQSEDETSQRASHGLPPDSGKWYVRGESGGQHRVLRSWFRSSFPVMAKQQVSAFIAWATTEQWSWLPTASRGEETAKVGGFLQRGCGGDGMAAFHGEEMVDEKMRWSGDEAFKNFVSRKYSRQRCHPLLSSFLSYIVDMEMT